MKQLKFRMVLGNVPKKKPNLNMLNKEQKPAEAKKLGFNTARKTCNRRRLQLGILTKMCTSTVRIEVVLNPTYIKS